MNVHRPLSAQSEVVNERRRWTQDWYTWLSDLSSAVDLSTTSLALTDAPSIVTDAHKGNYFVFTIAGNRTLANPSGLVSGIVYTWVITQGAGGSHTLAYDTNFTWPGGIVPTLSIAAGAVDVITATWDGVRLRASIQKGFA